LDGSIQITLFDEATKSANQIVTLGPDQWFQQQIRLGSKNADSWIIENGFDWTQVRKVRITCHFTGTGTGSFWVDGVFFGGRRYSATEEDANSQNNYGLRELVEVDEELWSDDECLSRVKALLANLKSPAESLSVRSTVVDYGSSPLLAGDTVHVALPNEGIDADFHVANVEYNVDAKTQTLETTFELGREAPLLADYIFALRSKTDPLEQVQGSEAGLSMDKDRRAVVEIRQDLHREIRRHAILNDVRIYELTNVMIEEIIRNEESVKRLINRLKQAK
jgi:hypothetical protein